MSFRAQLQAEAEEAVASAAPKQVREKRMEKPLVTGLEDLL